MVLYSSIALSVSVFLGTWSIMTSMQQKANLQRRLKGYLKRGSITNEGSKKIDADKLIKDLPKSALKSSLQKNLLTALLISCPIALAWFVYDGELLFRKLGLITLLLMILLRLHNIKKMKMRRLTIEEDLPRTLDLLVVCVEAGMSVNSALSRVAEEIKGEPLSEELKITFYELNAGISLEDAFKSLSDRTKVADVHSLTTAIIQAEKLGMGLAETLRSQSAILRESLRLRTKEKIIKLPVKMIIPLAIFIMPAIFTILAGPAYLQVKGSLLTSIDMKKSSAQNEAN